MYFPKSRPSTILKFELRNGKTNFHFAELVKPFKQKLSQIHMNLPPDGAKIHTHVDTHVLCIGPAFALCLVRLVTNFTQISDYTLAPPYTQPRNVSRFNWLLRLFCFVLSTNNSYRLLGLVYPHQVSHEGFQATLTTRRTVTCSAENFENSRLRMDTTIQEPKRYFNVRRRYLHFKHNLCK